MNRRWVCNDVWMDILPSFDRAQLGLKMALLSPRFDALVDKHFDGNNKLALWRAITICKDDVAAVPKLAVVIDQDNSLLFPLPDLSLPNKIRFHLLYIKYIDHFVIAFLRSNQQLWDKGTDFSLWISSSHDTDAQPIWDVLIRQIWPVFAQNIRKLQFYDGNHLDNLRSRISPTILTDLNIHSVYSYALLPDTICDDGPNATAGQALSKWVHTPSKNGQPKRLLCEDLKEKGNVNWVNSFKEAFAHATASVSYRIEFALCKTSIEPFESVNERTQQKLILIKISENGWVNRWIMKRCQIGETAVQWEGVNLHHLNTVYFWLCNQCIGPFSQPEQQQ